MFGMLIPPIFFARGLWLKFHMDPPSWGVPGVRHCSAEKPSSSALAASGPALSCHVGAS